MVRYRHFKTPGERYSPGADQSTTPEGEKEGEVGGETCTREIGVAGEEAGWRRENELRGERG